MPNSSSQNPHLQSALDYLQSYDCHCVAAGEPVLVQGGDPPQLGFVVEGAVRGGVRPRYGPIRWTPLVVVGDRHWFGVECIWGGHDLEYAGLIDAVVHLVPRDDLLSTAPREVLQSILWDASFDLARAIPAAYMARRTLRERVLSKLCDIREVCASPEIRITREELAGLVGAHRNRVGEVLSRLEEENLVECSYREILIGDRQQLLDAYRGVEDGGDDAG